MTTTISVRDLTKRYGNFAAVSDLTLEVEQGSICGLLGPNGSGKSTTFKCLLGLARPTSGSLAIEGKPVSPETFQSLGFVPERPALFDKLTVAQHLEVNKRCYRDYDPRRADELVDIFKLDRRKKAKRLSKGQQTALSLVLAFSYHPRILVLDEPASGLDPVFQRVALDLIIEAAANGATILFSSHQIGQVERAADRVAILKHGKLVLDGTLDSLKGSEKIVEAIFEGTVPETNGLVGDKRVRRFERSGRILRLYVRSDGEEFARRLEALGPRSVDILDLNLEDIFLEAVGDGERQATGGTP
ncbi:MAG TPA: ABC transporter ATP-binding protein [Candidatus Baltobacteraceae bacterium]|nr:ABC transporter ATP-binding protein [Candidatus Baltobacteraceae bacterium]